MENGRSNDQTIWGNCRSGTASTLRCQIPPSCQQQDPRGQGQTERQLNAEAKEAVLKDGSNPDDVGRRRIDNADFKAAILSSNERIQNAVKVREELSVILSIDSPSLMEKRLKEWSKVYSSMGISQLTRFTRTVTNRMEGIVSRATFHISSGKIESVNSLKKALRRSAFGYQDFDYFTYLI